MKNIPRFTSCDLLDQNNNRQDCVIFNLQQVISTQKNLVSIAHHHLFYQILLLQMVLVNTMLIIKCIRLKREIYSS